VGCREDFPLRMDYRTGEARGAGTAVQEAKFGDRGGGASQAEKVDRCTCRCVDEDRGARQGVWRRWRVERSQRAEEGVGFRGFPNKGGIHSACGLCGWWGWWG
jgi:hypothetical protein